MLTKFQSKDWNIKKLHYNKNWLAFGKHATKKVMEVVVGRNQDKLVWPDNCVSNDE